MNKALKQLNKITANTAKTAAVVLCLLTINLFALANDWPTYLHDNHRSGAAAEQLQLPLYQAWNCQTSRVPKLAWDETPALQDFWQATFNHTSRVKTKMASPVIVVGDLVYFGSSNSDKLICLNAVTGQQVWKFFTSGPVRFSPSYYGGKIYFGSDDGYAYCLNADDGSLVWKHRALDSDELMFANGRMVSVCPVRTAVIVSDGVAFWGSGLFSGAQTGLARYICAADAMTGTELWKITPPKPTQGYPLASADYLYMPAGKSTPTMYNISNGNYLGDFDSYSSRQGGAYALLTNDNKFFFGPHYDSNGSWIADYDAQTRDYQGLAWVYANHLVVTDTHSYYATDSKIYKIDRATKQTVWSISTSCPYSLILTGQTVFAGTDDTVLAIDSEDGNILWTGSVTGRANCLAAANGSLFVSTDTGAVYCFNELMFGDLDRDKDVDLSDFAIFAQYWLNSDCGDCGGADFGQDSDVGLEDLQVLIENWMTGLKTPPLIHYTLDETQGLIAYDSQNHYNGTLNNFPNDDSQWQLGHLNGALEFDGSNDFVEITGFNGIGQGNSRTVTAWIKTNDFGHILAWGVNEYGQKWVLRVSSLLSGTLGAIRAEVGVGYITGNTDLRDNTWHHVAAVLDNDSSSDISEVNLYVDGKLETISAVEAYPINTSTDNPFVIGAFLPAPQYFNGLLDDVRIYDRPLTADEILALTQQ